MVELQIVPETGIDADFYSDNLMKVYTLIDTFHDEDLPKKFLEDAKLLLINKPLKTYTQFCHGSKFEKETLEDISVETKKNIKKLDDLIKKLAVLVVNTDLETKIDKIKSLYINAYELIYGYLPDHFLE